MEIIYGKNSVETYLNFAPQLIHQVGIMQGIAEKTVRHFEKEANKHRIKFSILPEKEFHKKVSQKVVHQGIIAFVDEFAYTDLHEALAKDKKSGKTPLYLLLDQVQDPRNLGAIIRTADCAGGLSGIIITKNNSAEITPAAIKTSTGAALNIPIIQVVNARNTIQELKKNDVWICTLNMEGAVNYRSQSYDMPLCVVLGGEDVGVRPIIEKESDFKVFIPMYSKTVNSLNVSVAASLILYEISAQRN